MMREIEAGRGKGGMGQGVLAAGIKCILGGVLEIAEKSGGQRRGRR